MRCSPPGSVIGCLPPDVSSIRAPVSVAVAVTPSVKLPKSSAGPARQALGGEGYLQSRPLCGRALVDEGFAKVALTGAGGEIRDEGATGRGSVTLGGATSTHIITDATGNANYFGPGFSSHLDTGARRTFECDTVVFTGDWIPDHELARARGLAIDPGHLGPVVDTALRTSAPGVFAAGNLDLPRTEDDVLPYAVYDRQQIARSGVVSLSEFLAREVVDSDALSRPPEQTAGADLSAISGSTNLNLRGYKSEETILLVNGRRLPEIAISGSTTQQPDVNFIPLSLVQRVEVLPVSASALYSGNPVGGVINIVLRPDAEGSEVTTTYTNALHRFDAPQSSVSLLHGQTLLDGALRLRFSATFTRTEPATEAELGHIRAHLTTPALSDPVFRATPNIRSAEQLPLFAPGSSTVTSVAPGADGTGGLAAFNGRAGLRSLGLFDSVGGLANSSSSLDFPYGRRQQGESYFGSATYDITPWLQLGLDGAQLGLVLLGEVGDLGVRQPEILGESGGFGLGRRRSGGVKRHGNGVKLALAAEPLRP